MSEMQVESPLISLYGVNALDLASEEIRKLSQNSNIPFDNKYLSLGISFVNIKAFEILEGKKAKCSLSSLISEGFGEAAIYNYNVCDGVL